MRVSNLQLRIITAAFLIMLTLIASWVGGYIFTIFCLSVGAALYYEWQTLTSMHQTKGRYSVGWCLYAVVALFLIYSQSSFVIFATIFVSVAILLLLSGKSAGWVTGGFIYATVAPVALVLIRGDDFIGFAMLMFLYAVVWATDSGAYFTGKAIGGAKLVPSLSPNKTWSGAIGGAIAGVALSIAALSFLFDVSFGTLILTVPILLILGLILSIVSQLGDIGESWMKRHFQVKDSSNLLPGHGGFMDRLDGLITASIVFYMIAAILGHVDKPAVFFELLLK